MLNQNIYKIFFQNLQGYRLETLSIKLLKNLILR
jgi:hypothetical protein